MQKLEGVHSDDINCCDWSSLDSNMVLTGSNDTKVALLDVRKLGEAKAAVSKYLLAH